MEPTTKKFICTDIVQSIIQGEYRPNGLLSERKLMEKYGVSKSIVREALGELCNENVLRSIPRYGYEIVTLTESDVRNILQFRVMIECQSLPIVFQKASREELGELSRNLQLLAPEHDQEVWEAWENNSKFHLQLLALSGNRYCYDQIKRSLSILKRAYAQFYWDKWRRVRFHFDGEKHLRVTEALQQGDLALASCLLEQDINSFNAVTNL